MKNFLLKNASFLVFITLSGAVVWSFAWLVNTLAGAGLNNNSDFELRLVAIIIMSLLATIGVATLVNETRLLSSKYRSK